MPKPAKGETLTNKQKLFVSHYLTCWNATEAARRAGHPEKTAYAIGAENLRKPQIKILIDQYMAKNVMSSNEVLSRISQMASGNLIDVLNADDEFDFELARDKGLLHLVKKLKRRQYTDKDGNTTRETEVELYNAQDALEKLGRHYRLFASTIEITIYDSLAKKLGVTPEQARALSERGAKGEITISDVLTGKVKSDVPSNDG